MSSGLEVSLSIFACLVAKIFIIFFYQNSLFQKKKIFQEHYQRVKLFAIQISRDVLSGLIWVQTVCKDYQQMTKVAAGRQRVKKLLLDQFCI